ncbi:MAG: hypothetical protein ACXWJW_10885 [Xanthobacteraceae bacterium]
MTAAAIGQFETELSALEVCVDRAGRALGCCYSSAEEFEAENVRVWRNKRAVERHLMRARVVLGATAVTSLALLFVLAF